MKRNLKKIKEILREELPKLKSEYNVETLEIFGSFVRDEQQYGSDIDILVSFSTAPGFFKFIKLENYLRDLLEIKVDLVMRSALKPNIGKSIISEARPI